MLAAVWVGHWTIVLVVISWHACMATITIKQEIFPFWFAAFNKEWPWYHTAVDPSCLADPLLLWTALYYQQKHYCQPELHGNVWKQLIIIRKIVTVYSQHMHRVALCLWRPTQKAAKNWLKFFYNIFMKHFILSLSEI